MSLRASKPRSPSPGQGGSLRAVVWLVCALGAGSATGQAAGAGPDVLPHDERYRAAFRWQLPEAEAPQAPEPDTEGPGWVLDPGPEVGLREEQPDQASDDTEPEGRLLSRLLPADPEALGESLDTGFAFRSIAPAPVTAARADRWARSVFSDEASMLTPLTPGHEVVGWKLLDGLTLSGVGSRRVLTDRDRGFVISAEAGIRLTPRAGFQLGYELLQASTGAVTEDLGGDAFFARFQLRF